MPGTDDLDKKAELSHSQSNVFRRRVLMIYQRASDLGSVLMSGIRAVGDEASGAWRSLTSSSSNRAEQVTAENQSPSSGVEHDPARLREIGQDISKMTNTDDLDRKVEFLESQSGVFDRPVGVTKAPTATIHNRVEQVTAEKQSPLPQQKTQTSSVPNGKNESREAFEDRVLSSSADSAVQQPYRQLINHLVNQMDKLEDTKERTSNFLESAGQNYQEAEEVLIKSYRDANRLPTGKLGYLGSWFGVGPKMSREQAIKDLQEKGHLTATFPKTDLSPVSGQRVPSGRGGSQQVSVGRQAVLSQRVVGDVGREKPISDDRLTTPKNR